MNYIKASLKDSLQICMEEMRWAGCDTSGIGQNLDAASEIRRNNDITLNLAIFRAIRAGWAHRPTLF